DQQINAAMTLLLETRPNSKAIESARMATEMFLKAFLALRNGLTEQSARQDIRHNLEEAVRRCLAVVNHADLNKIQNEISCFPTDIGDRYRGTESSPRQLWEASRVAQSTGATIVRLLTGRDIRRQ
ncbi:MAG: hypothetical protein ABIU20_10650, partial [Blastocatellia bacterium]